MQKVRDFVYIGGGHKI